MKIICVNSHFMQIISAIWERSLSVDVNSDLPCDLAIKPEMESAVDACLSHAL